MVKKYIEKFLVKTENPTNRKINNIADVVGLPYGFVQAILIFELNKQHVSTKFVPFLPTTEQKEYHVEICPNLHQCAADSPSFMSRFILRDKSWVYGYSPETKQQSSQLKSPSSP
ncbi:uncharacterized protein LOC115214874 [Octopus sinensis]|uniref:Uncharacterized protein LOC115214874 n=1 Tax=Octopus sinensis TaxID=2607531 RepID=A0A6P7SNB1_9MOLL|nr:uncharacterized protein LOC115214874 [Octopus sinensis]